MRAYLTGTSSRYVLSLLGLMLLLSIRAVQASEISPETMGILINSNDPDSVVAGEYYQRARGIPIENVIRLSLPVDKAAISADAFSVLQASIEQQAPARIRAWAVMWRMPYRVACMSITSALAFGFNKGWCASGCKPTQHSPWFNADTGAPASKFGIRPAMMVQGSDLFSTLALIDKSVASDSTHPKGTAYLLTTSDKARSVRAGLYAQVKRQLGQGIRIRLMKQNSLRQRKGVMFYFTGAKRVAHVEENDYLPGAIADHLTSYGGRLHNPVQMLATEWIDAGVSGSYGTVLEPCNFPGKFPHPGIVMARYLDGDSLMEAYWKSVLMPGQGLFLGEPLARPFATVVEQAETDVSR